MPNAQLSLGTAQWVDVNTGFTMNNLPDRLPDAYAVLYSGLQNLFGCRVGERGRTFQPEYGNQYHWFLQEPIVETTARKIRLSMFQSIRRWEPRITLNQSQSYVVADTSIPGYKIRIGFSLPGSSSLHVLDFNLKVF